MRDDNAELNGQQEYEAEAQAEAEMEMDAPAEEQAYLRDKPDGALGTNGFTVTLAVPFRTAPPLSVTE